MDTCSKEVEDRNGEAEDSTGKYEEEDADLGNDSDDDCYKVAYTFDYP